jgi:prevent-host-death family protein
MRTVGAYEAKTHLLRLLNDVAKGETITITKHGTPVALLTPPTRQRMSANEAIAALHAFRQGRTLGDVSVRELVEEGRRY